MKDTIPGSTIEPKKYKPNRKLLLIEKGFFIAAVTLAEFYAMLLYTKMKWIADPIILPFIAVPLAITAVLIRRKRKKRVNNTTN